MALVQKQFGDLITFTRASAGGRFNAAGVFEMVPANQPRFDFDPVTKISKGILIEEARTNLLRSSGMIGSVGWGSSATSLSENEGAAPDASFTATRMKHNSGGQPYTFQIAAWNGGGTITVSIFAKASLPGDQLRLRILEGGGEFPSVSQTMPLPVQLTNEWQRLVFTATLQRNDRTSVQFIMFGSDGAEPLVWGAQLEVGAAASSYIPTVTAQVTRASDIARVNALNPWYNKNEGTLFVDFSPGAIGAGQTCVGVYFSSVIPAQNLISIRNGTGQGNINAVVTDGAGVTQFNLRGVSGVPVGARLKTALSLKNGRASFCVNGAAITSSSALVMPQPGMFDIGRATSAQQYANGHIHAVRYYPRSLTDSELQALTT